MIVAPFRKIPEHLKKEGKTNWLWGAHGIVEDWVIRDTYYVARLLLMFTPIPIFRAAFDQQGSRWTLQAIRMNGWLSVNAFMLPDQVQIINPVLILAFIPIFKFAYRLIDKCTYQGFVTPLRKMVTGMVFSALAYVYAGLIQAQIDKSLTIAPTIGGEMALRVINTQFTEINGKFYGDNLPDDYYFENLRIPPFNTSRVPNDDSTIDTMSVVFKTNLEEPYGFELATGEKLVFNRPSGRTITTNAVFKDNHYISYEGFSDKDSDGKWRGVFINTLNKPINITWQCDSSQNYCSDSDNTEIQVMNCNDDMYDDVRDDVENQVASCIYGKVGDDNSISLKQGTYKIVAKVDGKEVYSGEQFLGTGAAYTWIVGQSDSGEYKLSMNQDINTNDVSLLLIVPQFVLITVAEVLISITGLEFAYTQSPKFMKSVMQSCWLLCTSIGNLVVIIVAEGKFMPTQCGEYYLFAFMCGIAGLILALLAIFFYEYVPAGEFDTFTYPEHITGIKFNSSSSSEKKGLDNEALNSLENS